MWNIAQFKAELDQDGFLKTNQGQLIFSSPKILQSVYPDAKKLMLRADRFPIPSVWLTQDEEVRRYGYGPVDKTPHLALFDQFPVEFIVDKNGFVPDYFTKWVNGIINTNSSEGMLDTFSDGGHAYEHGYKDDYQVDLYVRIYRDDTQKVLTYQLSKAWPQSLPGANLAWAEQNGVLKFPVVFSFKEWKLIREDAPAEIGIRDYDTSIFSTSSEANILDRFLKNSIGLPKQLRGLI